MNFNIDKRLKNLKMLEYNLYQKKKNKKLKRKNIK